MPGIFFKKIIRREICTAAKPAVDSFSCIPRIQNISVGMHRWDGRIQGDAEPARGRRQTRMIRRFLNYVRMMSQSFPKTTDVLTPPFSNKFPFVISRVSFPPPPCSGRSIDLQAAPPSAFPMLLQSYPVVCEYDGSSVRGKVGTAFRCCVFYS